MSQGTGNYKVLSDHKDGELIFYESGVAAPHATYNLFTISTTEVKIGDTGNDVDFTIYLGSSSQYVKFDCGNTSFQITDDTALAFGTGSTANGDLRFVWQTTGTDRFQIIPTANNTIWEWGDGTTAFDLRIRGSDTTNLLYFDASADLLYTVGVDMQFRDSDKAVFGTGAGASGDVQLYFDGTSLILNTETDDIVFEIGDAAATQKSFDVRIYGNAANGADYFQFDAGLSRLIQAGAAEYGFGRMIYTAVTAKTSAYTVLPADTGTMFTTRGATSTVAFTLPIPADGAFLRFYNAVDYGMKIVAASANQIITFNDADADDVRFYTSSEKIGASVEAISDGTSWFIIPRGANTMTVTT